jgi:three-Cys-motif partner protein
MHNGHRGINHPVKNLVSGKGEITSQNHGFVVKKEDVLNHSEFEMTHEHLNDGTLAGMKMKNKNCDKIIEETKGIGLNLVFIDPTDCSVPFDLLKRIKGKIKNVDFIVNFAIRTDVNRNIRNAILFPKTHQNVLNKYTSFLGSDTFFTSQTVINAATQGNQTELRKLFRMEYMKSLKKIGYNHVDFKQIENYYDLVFASSHPKGIEFWKKANAIEFDGQRSLF